MNFFKAIVISAILLTSIQAMAAADSVAIFHKPQKVIVLINELGEGERLQTMLNYFEVGETLDVQSKDASIKVTCRRTISTASCTFRFLPSESSVIGKRSLEASSTLQELGLTILDDFDMSFESSMQDKFFLDVSNGKITFSASKKLIP